MSSYGKYYPVHKFDGKRSDGTEYSGETPAGYGGLFRADVTDMDGNSLHDYSVADYFLGLKNPDENEDTYKNLNFETWEIINEHVRDVLSKHMPEQDDKYHWQCGFGGDEGDGLIDFFCKEKIDLPPPSIFRVYGKSYRMTWYYDGDDDECLPDCKCENCKDPDSDHGEHCCCRDCTYRPRH